MLNTCLTCYFIYNFKTKCVGIPKKEARKGDQTKSSKVKTRM